MQADRSNEEKSYLHDLAVAFTTLDVPCAIHPNGSLEVRRPGVDLEQARSGLLSRIAKQAVTLKPHDDSLWWWFVWDETEDLLDPLGPAEDIAGAVHKILYVLEIEVAPKDGS